MERPFSLYSVLKVPPGAPAAAIDSAYRSLMKRHHPDHAGPASSECAAEINAAFSVLRDPARRAEYDRGEHKRQRAIAAAEYGRYARRRFWVRGGAWTAAALALGAGIPLAANWYDGGIVPPRTAAVLAAAPVPAAAPVAALETAPAAEPDPIERVADFLAEAARRRPVTVHAAPPKPQAAARAVPAESRAMLRRSEPRPRAPREPAERDFHEREGFIY
jgi:hypothetical protein